MNNSLLPIGDKSALSRIIEKFPKDVELVIPVGYKAQQIKDYLSIVHPDRIITFVDVDNWEGLGSGPGYSLLMCKPYLNCPFIFTSCDTLVEERVPEPDRNWVGVGEVTDSKDYCVGEVVSEKVIKLFDKVDTSTLFKICLDYRSILNNAFIGMAGIFDHKTFWEGLEQTKSMLVRNELQVSNGLSALIEKKLFAIPFEWDDVGHQVGYEKTNRKFTRNLVLPKVGESIYFESGMVIKFFADEKMSQNRVERARILSGLVPNLAHCKPHFYAYNFVDGKMLSETQNIGAVKKMFEFYDQTLWGIEHLIPEQMSEFKELCMKFYKDKTEKRVKMFFEQEGIEDVEEVINGVAVPPVFNLLNKIDWNWLADGVPVKWHGDFQPENIILQPDGKPLLLDWRQDFMGIKTHGDLYYDFGKMQHALLINAGMIRENKFSVKKQGNQIVYDFFAKGNLLEYEKVFHKFVEQRGYDLKKVKLLGLLMYLNIAPLHHKPYNQFLFSLGKRMLFDFVEENNLQNGTINTEFI